MHRAIYTRARARAPLVKREINAINCRAGSANRPGEDPPRPATRITRRQIRLGPSTLSRWIASPGT